MSDRTIYVHLDLDGKPILVGTLFARFRKRRETASFAYDEGWLKHPSKFALEPALHLDGMPYHTRQDQAMFGSIGDSAPDRWGKMLMRRDQRRGAQAEGRESHSLGEIDFLLGVTDETRLGALRFAEQPQGPFLAVAGDGPRVPPLIELPRLLASSDRIVTDHDDDDDLRLLLAPGSSLGGARPKASVRDRDGKLLIAKFPHPGDEYNQPAWEAVALNLARKAGINVSQARLESVAGRSVILLSRFDRQGENRIPFLSAMSLLGANDNEPHSYLEIVEALRRYSADPQEDLLELWRRIVFSILITNVDDHLRNHGLIWVGPAGWRLSPAYDLNPVPIDIKRRLLSLAINEADNTASLDLAFEIASYLGIDETTARQIVGVVGGAVSQWRQEAARLGLSSHEIDRMKSAFEHDELKRAVT